MRPPIRIRQTPEDVLQEIAEALDLEVKGPPFKSYPHISCDRQLDMQTSVSLFIRIVEDYEKRFIDIRVSWSSIPASEPKYAQVIASLIQDVLDKGREAERILGGRIWPHGSKDTGPAAEIITLSKHRG